MRPDDMDIARDERCGGARVRIDRELPIDLRVTRADDHDLCPAARPPCRRVGNGESAAAVAASALAARVASRRKAGLPRLRARGCDGSAEAHYDPPARSVAYTPHPRTPSPPEFGHSSFPTRFD